MEGIRLILDIKWLLQMRDIGHTFISPSSGACLELVGFADGSIGIAINNAKCCYERKLVRLLVQNPQPPDATDAVA